VREIEHDPRRARRGFEHLRQEGAIRAADVDNRAGAEKVTIGEMC
jgi:hypothetical protein